MSLSQFQWPPAVDHYAFLTQQWERRELLAIGAQIGSLILVSVTEILGWPPWPMVPASLFLIAAIAWVYRLVSAPAGTMRLFRANLTALQSLAVRYAFGSASLRSVGSTAQFQSFASLRETQLAAAYGRTDWPYRMTWADLCPTQSMTSMRDEPLADRITAYQARIDQVRKEYVGDVQRLELHNTRWTAIGLGAAIAGIALAIGQALGGPSGFMGLATTVSAGALAWRETRNDDEEGARLRLTIRVLDSGLIRLSEVHTEKSWAEMLDEIEDAVIAPYTTGVPIQSLPPLDP